MDRLAPGDARGLHLHAAGVLGVDGALAVDGLAEGVDHPAEQGVAHAHLEDVAGGLDRLALLDVAGLAEDHRADQLLFEVQGQPEGAVLELEQLVDGDAGQPAHPGDAVAHLGGARPTWAISVSGEYPSRCLRSAAVISLGLMVSSAIGAPFAAGGKLVGVRAC